MKIKHTILLVFSFVTLGSFAQSPKAKDLGLSVRWADRNVGASSPEEYGDYFAWGEVKTKRYYGDQSKYKFISTEPRVYYKYNYRFEGKGTVLDKLTVLQKDDDAATKIMGRRWRIPTAEEVDELINNCVFINYSLNGTRGYLVTNKYVLSDTLFIPLAGKKDYGNYRMDPATMGYYWTSTLIGEEIAKIDSIDPRGDMVSKAKAMVFSLNTKSPIVAFIKRNVGCTIRPVSNKN